MNLYNCYIATKRNDFKSFNYDYSSSLLNSVLKDFPYLDDDGNEVHQNKIDVKIQNIFDSKWWKQVFKKSNDSTNPYENPNFDPDQYLVDKFMERINSNRKIQSGKRLELKSKYTLKELYIIMPKLLRAYNYKRNMNKSYDFIVNGSYVTIMDGGLYIDNIIIPYNIPFIEFVNLSTDMLKKIRGIVATVEYKLQT